VATLIPLLALAALLGWVGWNGIKTDSGSSRGPAAGTQMPPFAAPIASSSLDGDVNVARTGGEGAAGARPACEVRGPDVLNSCDLVAQGPAAIHHRRRQALCRRAEPPRGAGAGYGRQGRGGDRQGQAGGGPHAGGRAALARTGGLGP
jgi:hypothetical protein